MKTLQVSHGFHQTAHRRGLKRGVESLRRHPRTFAIVFLSICVASFLMVPIRAAERPVAPRLSRTTEEITKVLEGAKGFGCLQSAQFSRWGRQVFAVWYCPFSGRAACYLHAYYYDHEKARWIRFLDTLLEGTQDLSAEMPTGGELLILKDVNEKVVVKESVAKFPQKKWYNEKKPGQPLDPDPAKPVNGRPGR
jgi:hypothetical protein